ncbi:MAG: hypothetical protein J3R72DRAFT_169726 [Linnemannia gamsii]|nr:MAG: hypothetical protein J3R72DRAFT_169726 [Linnemannia gamsii]
MFFFFFFFLFRFWTSLSFCLFHFSFSRRGVLFVHLPSPFLLPPPSLSSSSFRWHSSPSSQSSPFTHTLPSFLPSFTPLIPPAGFLSHQPTACWLA